MGVYAIIYDLNFEQKNYAPLFSEIKSLGGWWHYLNSFWLVDTSFSASQIYNHLIPFIDNEDHLLIIKVTKEYRGWLPNDSWDWLRKHL